MKRFLDGNLNYIFAVLFVFILAWLLCIFGGCCTRQTWTEHIVIDGQGYEYRLVSEEQDLPTGTVQVSIWERIRPVDTKHWWTPTQASLLDGKHAPTFVTIARP